MKPGGIFDVIFKQFVGIGVRGKIWDPSVFPLPFYNGLETIWQKLKATVEQKFDGGAAPDRAGRGGAR